MSTQNPVFIPGSTNIPEELRRVVDFLSIDHWSPVFVEMLRPVLDGVMRIFKTATDDIIPFPATETGAWEAAVNNILSPLDKVLAARHRILSHRWMDFLRTSWL